MSEEELFIEAGNSVTGAEKSQMFGKPCFKLDKKAFVCFFQNEMVFKLNGDAHRNALSLDGSQLFDPSGKGRAMKEWVQVSVAHTRQWKVFAQAAAEYVAG